MLLSLATWNINSVRRRIGLVLELLRRMRPDILCLQETKCQDDAFPRRSFQQLGYPHLALNGQKGYHGVAIISKLPFDSTLTQSFCGREESRHIAVSFGKAAGLAEPLRLDNFYVPAGGDVADPEANDKFAHKLQFLDEMAAWPALRPAAGVRRILVGDLNVAPFENDVWSHRQLLKVVSHTPVECEKLLAVVGAGAWSDVARERIPMIEKVYTWWSYRNADWTRGNRGRRLDHIWVSHALKGAVRDFSILREARSWEQPSDHVPVMVALEV